jgi:translocation and assembly module TamA
MRKLIQKCLLIICCLVTCTGFAKPTVRFITYGVDGDIKTNVLAQLQEAADSYLSAPTPNAIDYFIHQAPSITYKAVAPYGYLDAQVKQTVTNSGNQWTLSYNITLGTPTVINKTAINITGAGADTKLFQKIVTKYAPKVGTILNINIYNNFINQLAVQANKYGYFNAKMTTRKIIVDKQQHSAEIVIAYNTGLRSRFGITYFNQTPLSIKFLRRYVGYCANTPYSEQKLQKLQEDLTNSNYFTVVSVRPEINKMTDNLVPIKVTLKANKARKYTLGAGYGTDTGIRTTLGLDFRRFTKTGDRLSLAGQLSSLSDSATAEYIIPGKNPAKNFYTISGGYAKQDLSIGSSNAIITGISYTTMLQNWTQTLSLSYLNEKYNIATISPIVIDSNMLIPSISWSRKRTDNHLKPNKGYYVILRLSGAEKALLSRNSFYQAYLDSRFLHSFFANRTRLLLQGELGYTNINNLSNLPLSLQLLAGGAQSVRGYSYRSIGPGNILRVSSVELQQKIYKDFYLAGFYDAAVVSNSIGRGTIYQSSGPAAVWLSPIGMIEISIAKRLGNAGNNQWRMDFSMGSAI